MAQDNLVSTNSIQDEMCFFFPVSRKKLAVMSIFTLGLYQIFWFLKNWGAVMEWKSSQNPYNAGVNPIWRTVFSVIYCLPLFKLIRNYSRTQNITVNFEPAILTGSYVILCYSYKLPDPWWFISILNFLPLLFVQKAINDLHYRYRPNEGINDKFSAANIAGIVIGGIFNFLAILSLLIV